MCSSVADADLESLSVGELVEATASIAAELARREVQESAATCLELTETLARASDVQEGVLARMIAVVDGAREMRRWGFPSVQAWLRSGLGMREVHVRERVVLARQLPRLPEVAQGLAGASVSFGYATAIAGSVARLGEADCARAESVLLDMADDGFSPGKVAAFGARIGDVIAERDGCERPPGDAARGYERSWLTCTRSLDGGRYLQGWLNAEDAAVFDGSLGPLAKPAGPEDPRDLPERMAAALTGVLSGGHRATKVTLIVDLDTLTGGRAPARLPDGTPIPAAQARRIALAAGVSPLLLGPGGVPLYLGRRARFASPGQRRVLEALYESCAVRGCHVPATLCEVDHVDGWALGDSPTDIDRLALCCGWHNRYKHTNPGQITVHKTHDGRYVYRLPKPHLGDNTRRHKRSSPRSRAGPLSSAA